MQSFQKCRRETIKAFLNDQLSSTDLAAFEEHLNDCDACCHNLEAMTVDEQWWNDASGYLDNATQSNDSVASDGRNTESDAGDREQLWLDFLAPTDDPRMLGRFGAYEIAGVVGYGGMGIVLKGFDAALNRFVAIKLLAPHYATSGAARKRFLREAQAAAAVVHDNVTAIHGVNEFNNLPYIVMPYVRGESLQKRLDRCGSLEVVEILRIAMQTASGLAAAHAQGLVHRDIKPANILLPDGVERVLITDFGLARAADDASLTRSGVIAGTPQYMSPEQARGDKIDARSDLFSLGSVMYAMCTGHVPFRAETPYGILRRITDHEPRPIRDSNREIPTWLNQIVERLLRKDPSDRYQTAKDVEVDLQQCLLHLQTPEAPLPKHLASPLAMHKFRYVRRPKVAIPVAVGLALLGLILTSGVSMFPGNTSFPDNASKTPTAPKPSVQTSGDMRWESSLETDIRSIQQTIDELLVESQTAFKSQPTTETKQ